MDQLAEKSLTGDPSAAANTSNLYAVLDSSDHLIPTGFGAVQRGHWKDPDGLVYDRKYSATGGALGAGDTANLFVRGGDDAPEFGNTSTAAIYSTGAGSTTLTFGFNETMDVRALVASNFSITPASGSALTATTATMTATGMSLGYSGAALSGVLRVQYIGSNVLDQEGEQLRLKDISVGSSNADSIDASGRTTDQALFGNSGNDVIKSGSGSDLIVGGAGNDNLSGGAGADVFRFIQFETGTDTITDFKVAEGDKIDLRGLLKDVGLTLDNLGLYVRLDAGVNEMRLKVDTLGTGNFSAPDLSVSLLSPQGLDVTLAELMDQRVFMVL